MLINKDQQELTLLMITLTSIMRQTLDTRIVHLNVHHAMQGISLHIVV